MTQLQSASYHPSEPWYLSIERLSGSSLKPTEVIEKATIEIRSNQRWAMPMAMAHWLEGRYADAYQILSSPDVELACNDIWVYHNLIGMTCRQIDGMIPRALAAYRRSLILEPERADTLYNYANLLKDEDPEESLVFYEKSIRIEPVAPSAWHNYGTALNNCNKHRNALTCLKLSLMLDPKVPDVWCNLGLSYFGLENYNAAEHCFRHAISLDGHAQSHINLGNTLINL